MLFTYKALRKDNSSVSGTIEAADRDAAMTALSHQGLHPLLVSEASARRGFGLNKKVKSSDMVIFTRQLSTMISAGVPIARGLATLQESANSAYFREVLGKITKDIEGGTQLGDQLLGLSPEVALPPPVDGVEAGPDPEPQEPAHELVVLAALHDGHEHAEEAILLVEVAALAREVLDHLEGLVEARERGVLLRGVDPDHVAVSCDETTVPEHLELVLAAFAVGVEGRSAEQALPKDSLNHSA